MYLITIKSNHNKSFNTKSILTQMYGTTGKLIIRPNMADLKTDKSFIFKADPYCCFFLGEHQMQKTIPCHNGGKHPLWNDVLEFDRENETTLSVQIWDRDRITKDDFICAGTLDISQLLISGVQSHAIDLYNKGVFIGKLFIEMEWQPIIVSKATQMQMPMETQQKTITTTSTMTSDKVHEECAHDHLHNHNKF